MRLVVNVEGAFPDTVSRLSGEDSHQQVELHPAKIMNICAVAAAEILLLFTAMKPAEPGTSEFRRVARRNSRQRTDTRALCASLFLLLAFTATALYVDFDSWPRHGVWVVPVFVLAYVAVYIYWKKSLADGVTSLLKEFEIWKLKVLDQFVILRSANNFKPSQALLTSLRRNTALARSVVASNRELATWLDTLLDLNHR